MTWKCFFLPCIFLLTTFTTGCQERALLDVDEETAEILIRLSQRKYSSDAELTPDLIRLSQIILDIFEEETDPVSKSDGKPCSALISCDGFELLRWGGEMPSHPSFDKNAGALIIRSVSVGYDDHLPLVVDGPWEEMFKRTYRTFEKTFDEEEKENFLNSESNTLDAENEVINLADHGLVFAYDSESLFRRVQSENLPGGEALMHWENMLGKAERLEGGYHGYMDFLLNFQIYLALKSSLSWRIAMTWVDAGGSLFIFGGTANSGDIAKGMRKDYEDLEAFLENTE